MNSTLTAREQDVITENMLSGNQTMKHALLVKNSHRNNTHNNLILSFDQISNAYNVNKDTLLKKPLYMTTIPYRKKKDVKPKSKSELKSIIEGLAELWTMQVLTNESVAKQYKTMHTLIRKQSNYIEVLEKQLGSAGFGDEEDMVTTIDK